MKKPIVIFIILTLTVIIVIAVVLKKNSRQRYYPLKFFSSEELGVKRGSICDVNGQILVISQPAYKLLAEPKKIDNRIDEVMDLLARELAIPQEYIIRKIRPALEENSQKVEVTISRKIESSVQERLSDKLDEMNIKGIRFALDFRRHYPNGPLMAPLLGLLADGKAAGGIEEMMNFYLIPARRVVFYRPTYLAKGATVSLTLDKRIQQSVEKELEKVALTYDAEIATLIMANPLNGKILAMAQWPGFDPISRNAGFYHMQNRVAIDGFAPGALIDPLVLAAGLEELDRMKIHGKDEVIEDGNDIENVLIPIIARLKPAQLYNGLLNFGFGEKTGIGLNEESKGIVRAPDKYDNFLEYPLAMRQLIFPTSLQMLKAYCTLANEGRKLPFQIIESVQGAETEYGKNLDIIAKSVISLRNSERVLSCLQMAEVNSSDNNGSVQLLYKTAHTSDEFYSAHKSPKYANIMAGLYQGKHFPFVMLAVLYSKHKSAIPRDAFLVVMKNILRKGITL